MPVIHADKFQVEKNNTIRWSLLNKTITSKIVKTETISVGGLRNYEEIRDVVKLYVEIDGGFYKDIELPINDREDRTPILLDRALMKQLNIIVNSQRK